MKTLLLVDGSSYLYRAFHAMPDLRNKLGEPTGAVYGVLNMLRKLRTEIGADYIACVFDAKGKTFRDELYADYKANRPSMPDDLVRQIEPLHQSVQAMGWPLLSIPGVEADDVIGTLARTAEAQGIQVLISTGDKDITQLVSPVITLVNTMTDERLDEAGVLGKFGVRPDQIVDYLTLVGDSVDNVPGVEKVGPKTAVKWLTQYPTLESLVEHAADVTGAVGDNLRKALSWLPTAKQLLTIKCDVPLSVKIDDLIPMTPNVVLLAPLFERLEFKTWRRELGAAVANTVNAPMPAPLPPALLRDYETVTTDEHLDRWMEFVLRAALVCIDTETTGLDPMLAKLVGISLCIEPGKAAYIPLEHRYAGAPTQLRIDTVLGRMRSWLEDASCKKLGQNLKYDSHVFANHGIILRGIAHDTLLQSYVIESHQPHNMDDLASRHLGLKTITYDEVTGTGAGRISFDQVDIARATEYAAEDADVTLRLHRALLPQLESDPRLAYVYGQIEIPAASVLFAMERKGVLLDSSALEIQSRELGEKMLQLERAAHEQAGQPFNLNSPKQIQEILFTQLKLPVVKKTPGGAPSTDEDVLQQLALDFPLPRLILDYRGVAKLKSTYTDKLPRMINDTTGRVHTNYNQAVAVTGRLASNDPNLQNIPVRTAEGRRIREAFIAPPGQVIVSADYSQVELRIMAHLSRDPNLLASFAAGQDVHRRTAAEIFGITTEEVSGEQRRYAKVINFGLIYGMSAFGLATQLGIARAAAQQYMDRYFARYPGVAEYMQRTRDVARERGYVETIFGRRLYLPEIKGGSGARRQGAERAAINAPMQGTAADLIKLAMIVVQQWIQHESLQARLIMQVHDELVLEVPDFELERVRAELPSLMTGVAKLEVPLLVDVGFGPNWDKAH